MIKVNEIHYSKNNLYSMRKVSIRMIEFGFKGVQSTYFKRIVYSNRFLRNLAYLKFRLTLK